MAKSEDELRSSLDGALVASDCLIANIKDARGNWRLQQQDLAERMRGLGFDWRRATVSEVERGRRKVSVNELCALAAVFGRSVADMLQPPRPVRNGGPDWDAERPYLRVADQIVMSAWMADEWLRDEVQLLVKWRGNEPVDLDTAPITEMPPSSREAESPRGMVELPDGEVGFRFQFAHLLPDSVDVQLSRDLSWPPEYVLLMGRDLWGRRASRELAVRTDAEVAERFSETKPLPIDLQRLQSRIVDELYFELLGRVPREEWEKVLGHVKDLIEAADAPTAERHANAVAEFLNDAVASEADEGTP